MSVSLTWVALIWVALIWVALIWAALIWVTLCFDQNSYYFHSIFITWELIQHTPKWNKFDQMELLHIISQQYIHIQNQKNCTISIFKFCIENDFSTQTLALPENHVKSYKSIILNITTLTPTQQTTFHWYASFTKFHTFSDIELFLYLYSIFSALLNLNLTPKNPKFKVPKILPGTLSLPKLNQKSPKDLKLILILTTKQATCLNNYTFCKFCDTITHCMSLAFWRWLDFNNKACSSCWEQDIFVVHTRREFHQLKSSANLKQWEYYISFCNSKTCFITISFDSHIQILKK